jgi:hypothetical protein
MARVLGSGIFILIMLLIDWYVFQAVKHVSQTAAPKTRVLIYIIYWALTLASVCIFLFGSVLNVMEWPKMIRIYVFAIHISAGRSQAHFALERRKTLLPVCAERRFQFKCHIPIYFYDLARAGSGLQFVWNPAVGIRE